VATDYLPKAAEPAWHEVASNGKRGRVQQSVIVLDVNETLSDLRPLAERFAEVGAGPGASDAWFAATLRDGFALSIADARPVFDDVAREAARMLLSRCPLDRPLVAAVQFVMDGIKDLPLHPDVGPALRRFSAHGFRTVTLSNGPTSLAHRLLERDGLLEHVEQLFSVEEQTAWKPAPAAYGYAAAQLGVAPWDMVLAACHPWDVDGAIRAGLRGVWVNRADSIYPGTFTPPTATVTDLTQLVDVVAEPVLADHGPRVRSGRPW
jgi:2-haloacid dehalogenase